MEDSLRRMLLPKDPRDSKNVIVEIRAGAGGDEAGIFAGDLFRMYSRYAEEQRWEGQVLSARNRRGGYKRSCSRCAATGVFALKYESGVHRVQRPRDGEPGAHSHLDGDGGRAGRNGRRRGRIDPGDLQIDTYRSAGAGSQNVQKNETAIRITHLPTGLVVACQDERSQLQNKLQAMNILRAKLYDMEQERLREAPGRRPAQPGGVWRPQRENPHVQLPQNRVTDHRIGMSSQPARHIGRQAGWSSTSWRRAKKQTACRLSGCNRVRSRDRALAWARAARRSWCGAARRAGTAGAPLGVQRAALHTPSGRSRTGRGLPADDRGAATGRAGRLSDGQAGLLTASSPSRPRS